jgi:hypothetical protein
MLKQGFAFAASIFAFLPILNAQSTPTETLLALSKRDHTLAIVDPLGLRVSGKSPGRERSARSHCFGGWRDSLRLELWRRSVQHAGGDRSRRAQAAAGD